MSVETFLAFQAAGCYSSLDVLPTLIDTFLNEDECLKLCDNQLFSYCSFTPSSCKGGNEEPTLEQFKILRDGRCQTEELGTTLFKIGAGSEQLKYLSDGAVNKEEINQTLLQGTLFKEAGCFKRDLNDSPFLKYHGSMAPIDCLYRCSRLSASFCAIENGSRGCWSSWSPSFDTFSAENKVDESGCGAPCRFPSSLTKNLKCGGMSKVSIYRLGEGGTIFDISGPVTIPEVDASKTIPSNATQPDVSVEGISRSGSNDTTSSNRGLSSAVIVLISLGTLLFLIAAIALFMRRRIRKNRQKGDSEAPSTYKGEDVYSPPAIIISKSLPSPGNDSPDNEETIKTRRRSSFNGSTGRGAGISSERVPPSPIIAPFNFTSQEVPRTPGGFEASYL